MPSPNKIALRAYLTPEEYKKVIEQSDQAGLSISTFVKRVCLAQEIRSTVDQEAVLALLKTNADCRSSY